MDDPLAPLPPTQIRLTDRFWRPRLDTNRTVTIPYVFTKCEQTGRIDNFTRAAGLLEGPHEGVYYNDSDVFKAIEGASRSLSLHPDPDLDRYLDALIAKIAAAQEGDGYLYTARTIDPGAVDPQREGAERWTNLRTNHELYNLGHLYEAAVAHHEATGKRTLLEVALKSADLIDRVFGADGLHDVPGHQEIEIGLVKLYRTTGERRYLELAKLFLDRRGRPERRSLQIPMAPGRDRLHQDHLPVTEQREAVGHAVRAGYQYSGMADVAALTGDRDYLAALDDLWRSAVTRRMYLTGGIGSRHRGEAFGEDFELPNVEAYAETCAAIAHVLWSWRMFLLHGDATYLDVLERALYNGVLAGVSLQGDTFFYANPLASDGVWPFNVGVGAERSPWFGTSCCPTNVVRLLPSLPGFAYACRGDRIYPTLYIAGEATFALEAGGVTIRQETDYPWSGAVRLTIDAEARTEFGLHLRIPGWARDAPVPGDLYRYVGPASAPPTLRVNGERVELAVERGFAVVRRVWRAGDVVELDLPMPPRRVLSHEGVVGNRGRVAVERGPLVYCAEGVDHGGRALELALPDDATLVAERDDDLLGGVTLVRGGGVTLLPYYAWAHRGAGEMAVWLRRVSGGDR